jgi:hypothetical protein
MRLQLEVSERVLERVNFLKERTGVGSQTDVVRNALRLYDWFVEEFGEERTIEIHAQSGKVEKMPLMLLLHHNE